MYKKYFTFLVVLFISCTSLKETIITENPDFIKHAYNFKITSPLSHDNASFNKFIPFQYPAASGRGIEKE